jgi:hypothetical protein
METAERRFRIILNAPSMGTPLRRISMTTGASHRSAPTRNWNEAQQESPEHNHEGTPLPGHEVDYDAMSVASDNSPIIPTRLEERFNRHDHQDDKLSHRVWEDVKRRLHMLNVYLGIDTDEDESYSYLFDDQSYMDDHSIYAPSDRSTATTVASSSEESSVCSDAFEYGDDDDEGMMIRRIASGDT